MDIANLRQIITKIKDKSKEDARVDTGTLKRSIYGIINERGVAEFGEMFYGQFGENSKLEENINKLFPKSIPYKLLYYDLDGVEYEAKRRTVGGRTIKKELPKKEDLKPTTSKNIKNFLSGLANKKIEEDGEKTDSRRKE